MQIAILLPDRYVAIDAVSAHAALSVDTDAQVAFVAERPGPVRDTTGRVELTADAALHEIPRPDVIVVPGTTRAAPLAGRASEVWLRGALSVGARLVLVGSGSCAVAPLGLLEGVRVAAVPSLHPGLARWGARPQLGPVVTDGTVTSAAEAADASFITIHPTREET